MKAIQMIVAALLLMVCLGSCIVRRHEHYGSGRYRREHVPSAPPGYRGF